MAAGVSTVRAAFWLQGRAALRGGILPKLARHQLNHHLLEVLAVHIIDKNILPPVAPVLGMPNGAWMLQAHRARHGLRMTNSPATARTLNGLAGRASHRSDAH